MPDLLYDGLTFSGLDDAIDRFRAFAKAHVDFEPNLMCERDRAGRRRWVLSVGQRNAADVELVRKRRSGCDEGER